MFDKAHWIVSWIWFNTLIPSSLKSELSLINPKANLNNVTTWYKQLFY